MKTLTEKARSLAPLIKMGKLTDSEARVIKQVNDLSNLGAVTRVPDGHLETINRLYDAYAGAQAAQ